MKYPPEDMVLKVSSSIRNENISKLSCHSRHTNQTNNAKHDFSDYEWPQLPPIDKIKEAICRQRVSDGLSYLLPVDKTRNSVNACYRTDLRSLFKTPYLNNTAFNGGQYDNIDTFNDARVQECKRYHQTSNTRVTYQSPDTETPLHVVNSDSQKALVAYARSAPRTGISNRRTIGFSEQLRRRSSLYRTTHDHDEHPDVIQLRENAEKIVRAVYGDQIATRSAISTSAAGASTPPAIVIEDLHEQEHTLFNRGRRGTVATLHKRRDLSRIATINPPIRRTCASQFSCYEALINEALPSTRYLPPSVISPYLSMDKNTSVWEWLHDRQLATKFSHFMDICG